ncbi:MAG: hypothetical protein MI922_08390, partial [Bacteroidales bacterium]|nr:hypothetical protein [Bacteroidales bacterium]
MNNKVYNENIEKFYGKFRQLPEYFDYEKVHQLIDNPNAVARLKGKFFRPLNWIIMIGIITLVIFGFLNFNKEIPITDLKEETNIEYRLTNFENPKNDTARLTKKVNEEQDENVKDSIDSGIAFETKNKKSKIPLLVLNKEELRNIGFNINHRAVFYRNTTPGHRMIFATRVSNNMFETEIDGEILKYKGFKTIYLREDTLNNSVKILDRYSREISLPREERKYINHYYTSTNKNYHPRYQTEIDEETDFDLKYESELLIPVLVRISMLNCEIKKDQIFWFEPNKFLFQDLPDRYKYLEKMIESEFITKNKYYSNVPYRVNEWINNEILPKDTVIDGSKIRLELTINELQKIGIHKTKDGFKYNYLTKWGRGKTNIVVKKNNKILRSDSLLFFSDLFFDYSTYMNGEFRSSNRTSKMYKEFPLKNDVLLPIVIKTTKNDHIFWFAQSDTLWSLLPGRYQCLKRMYEKVQFSKTIYPNKDFIVYFPQGFETVDVNTNVLKLSKEELQNIGFKINEDTVWANFCHNKFWAQYRTRNRFSNMPKYVKMRTRLTPTFHVSWYSNLRYYEKNNQQQKADSMLNIAVNGITFLFTTDTEGHILSQSRFIKKLNPNNDILIPILIKETEFIGDEAEDKIVWFLPTNELIRRLPDHIRPDLQRDIEFINNSIITDTNTASCTYFEVCKSTLDFKDFKMYPNPLKDNINIEFKSDIRTSTRILVHTINGKIIKELAREE